MFLYFKVRKCFLWWMQREIELGVVLEAAKVTKWRIANRDGAILGRDGEEQVLNAHLSY